MKKYIIPAILAIATAVSCQEIDINPAIESNDTILYAKEVKMKTLLADDFSVSWTGNDRLTVFNAASGTTTYSDNCKFIISDIASGKFIKDRKESGKNLISGASAYDWYVCYPWLEYASNPGGTKGYTVNRTPKQIGYNSRAHIEQDDIMAGKALNVAESAATSVQLHHVGALMKFSITNNSGKASTITGLTLDAEDGGTYITGSFTMDWTGAVPVLDPTKMGSAQQYTCALSVVQNNGNEENPDLQPIETEIANGESVDLYMVMAPFTIAAGKKITLTISGSEGICVLEKIMPSRINFEAGTYNTAQLSYSPVNIVFTETFGENTVATANVPSYGKAGLTTADPAHKDGYSYSVTGNASFAALSNNNKVINPNYSAYQAGAVVKLPATSATSANSAIFIKGITVKANTTYIFKYNKSKGIQNDAEFDTTTSFKWRKNGEIAFNNVNATVAAGTIEQEFTTGDFTTIDIGVEATDRNPSGTITIFPSLDYFQLIEK